MTEHLPALRYPPPPANIAAIVKVLGADMAITFLLTFGGAELYLAQEPKGVSQVETVIGADRTRALQAALGSYPRRIPLAKAWLARCLAVRGETASSIARTLRTTDVTVRRMLAAVEPDRKRGYRAD